MVGKEEEGEAIFFGHSVWADAHAHKPTRGQSEQRKNAIQGQGQTTIPEGKSKAASLHFVGFLFSWGMLWKL